MKQISQLINTLASYYPLSKRWVGLMAGLALLFPLLLIGCMHKPSSTSSSTRTITDMLNREVDIPLEVGQIIGVGPGALRFLVYMQLTDRVSGVEDVELRPGRAYAYAQPSLSKKTLIGPMHGGDAELLAANQPDVIFMMGCTAGQANDLQKQTGIPVVALLSGNLNDQRATFYRALQTIGKITRTETRATAIIQFVNNEEVALKQLMPVEQPQPRVYVGGVSYSGARGLTSTLPLYDAFEFVNAHNVAKELSGTANAGGSNAITIDIEQLMVWNPTYLFVDAAGLALSQPQLAPDSPLRSTLTAFEENRLFTLMPYNWYATNYETILVNAWYIASVIYPGKVSSHQFTERRNTIYEFMLGKDVSKDLLQMYEGWKALDNQ